MPKLILTVIVTLLATGRLSTQEKARPALGIEAGFIAASGGENLGLFLTVEPKLNVAKNTFIGLRIGAVVNAQSFEHFDPFQYDIDTASDNGGLSFVPTVEYNWAVNHLRPFLGIGLGTYLLANYVDVTDLTVSNPADGRFESHVKNRLGALFRGGLETNRLRFGVEYNRVASADITTPDGRVIGSVDNSYLGLSIGFVIGGRRNLPIHLRR